MKCTLQKKSFVFCKVIYSNNKIQILFSTFAFFVKLVQFLERRCIDSIYFICNYGCMFIWSLVYSV